jgi:hypothetical protein
MFLGVCIRIIPSEYFLTAAAALGLNPDITSPTVLIPSVDIPCIRLVMKSEAWSVIEVLYLLVL